MTVLCSVALHHSTVGWVGLQCVIVVFPDHTQLILLMVHRIFEGHYGFNFKILSLKIVFVLQTVYTDLD